VINRYLFLLLTVGAAVAQTPDAMFQAKCAGCHNAGNSVGAPPLETLRRMSSQAILAALETGKMKEISSGMSAADRESLAKSIGVAEAQPALVLSQCVSPPALQKNAPAWNGWADLANTRFQPARAAGLTSQTTPKLKLRWAFGFAAVTTAFGAPAVFAGRVFVGAANGAVYFSTRTVDASIGHIPPRRAYEPRP
jgi:polyvinyl alcohol dehydrogenase (cytochrome)